MNTLLAQNQPESDAVVNVVEKDAAEILDLIKNLEWSELLDKFLEWLLAVGPKFLLALVFLFIGFKVSNIAAKVIKRTLDTARVDKSLSEFLSNVVRFVLKIFVLILSANLVGIPLSSFIAILGAAGLAIGLALKDGLGNFAGGVVLLLFKPIKVGDLVTIGAHHGFVESISIFYTLVTTKNNETVTIPNGTVANGEVTNYSTTPLIRIQTAVGIGYGDDIKKARELMLAQTQKDDRIAQSPAPTVVLKELGDNSVNLELRSWSDPKLFRQVHFLLNENIKEAFDANGITIPYPQRDLHVINDGAEQPNSSV